jgi:hypothetical protein
MVRPADGAPRRVDAALIAVLLACVSALLFGAMSVGLRIGLGRHPGVELATVSTVLGALAVALVANARRLRELAEQGYAKLTPVEQARVRELVPRLRDAE